MFQRLRLAISKAFIFTIHRIFMHKESDSQTAERNSAVIISLLANHIGPVRLWHELRIFTSELNKLGETYLYINYWTINVSSLSSCFGWKK